MQELTAQLARLYVPAAALDALQAQLAGALPAAVDLVENGATRAIIIPFDRQPDDGEAGHWERLCAVANALQADLGLPAPAVSISGASGYRLWLSLAQPVPLAQARRFVEGLRVAYFPRVPLPSDGVGATVEVPPCLHHASGRWAAFIHPGMGASFAEEPGLEMAPPLTAQAAFLEPLESIGAAQFQRALDRLRPAAPAPTAPWSEAVAPDLLLKDATLEDIVRFLHSKNIEPTFRHLLPR
jgi:hypothetical protein